VREAKLIPTLTPLRGLAALWVLGYHVSAMALGSSTLAGRGDIAVDFFFILSGFVLSHVYGTDARPNSQFIAPFLWARFCRIWPLVGLMAVLLAAILPGASVRQFLLSATLTEVPLSPAHLSSGALPLNGTEWSVSAEIWAYLLFPIIAPMILQNRGRVSSAWATIVSYTVFAVLREGTFGGVIGGVSALVRALPEFILGMYLYRAYATGGRFVSALGSDWAAAVMLVGAAVSLYSPMLMVAAAPAVVLVGACARGRAALLLNSMPLVWLGELSYAIYISQWLPLELGGRLPIERPARAMIIVIGAIAFAAALHYAVEIPARRWLRCIAAPVRGSTQRFPGSR
jgi:peptidoglycan/LPS O-acetylase OafA/YrhL